MKKVSEIFVNSIQGWQKFRSLLPIYGIFGTLKLISNNILLIETVFRMEVELKVPIPWVEPKIPLQVKIISKGIDLETWVGRKEILDIRGPYGLDQFQKRFEHENLCFIAYWESQFVGFNWIEFPPVFEAGYPLKQNEAYTFDVFTFEKYRGNQVLPFLQYAILEYIQKNRPEIQRVVAHVATWNKYSLSGFRRAGYRAIRLERNIMFLGFHIRKTLTMDIPPEFVMD